jgi:outer membrane receptor protein involved in Fe transport
MNTLFRAVCVVVAFAFSAGPLSAAAAEATQTVAQTAVPTQTAVLSGIVTDGTGAPLAGVTVSAKGASNVSTTSDPKGLYSLTLLPGIYDFSATKSGYVSATSLDYPILAGTTVTLNVTLTGETFSSLKQIARVGVSAGRSGFNTSAASVQTISQQTFIDQGQQQVQHVLEQTPGIVIDHPGTSANNAAPGAITFPSIRGGLGFETASLIDGHPLAVQTFGDYVTTFLNSYVLQSVELIKGPGADAPETYYAINGTVNFRTLDPTKTLTGRIDEGTDSFGGLFSNYRISGPVPGVPGNKLKVVLDFAIDGTPGPLKDSKGYINLPSGTVAPNGYTYGFSDSANPNPININNPFASNSTLLACCAIVNQNYNGKTELAKLRYDFSNSTEVTASYLGSQTYTDQNGNHVYGINTNFTPGATYTGALTPGTVGTYQNVFLPNDEYEINNEPIFQGELRTTFHGDTILGRYYTASINRLQYNTLQSQDSPLNPTLYLYGTVTTNCPTGYKSSGGMCVPTGSTGTPFPNAFTYNGQPVTVSLPGQYFRETEEDKLHGGSGEYDHYFGTSGDVLSFVFDQTNVTTNSYEYEPDYVPSVVPGSAERYTTYLLRAILNPTDKFNVTLSNYLNNYALHYTNGDGFTTQTYTQDDPRIGLTYRATRDISLRASAGASLAPPYLALLSSSPVTSYKVDASGTFATATHNVGNVKAETSFGYDAGADFRLSPDGFTVLTTDLYLNNVKNQFVSGELLAQGLTPLCVSGTTGKPVVGGTCPTGSTLTSLPTYFSSGANVNNARYEGLEVGINRDPSVGFGFTTQGALIRAYPYDISPCLYSNVFTNGVQNCTKATTNLGIISGANFYGSGSSGSNGMSSNGAGSNFNSVNNHAIPYAQGYASIHFRTLKGGLVEIGETYYGPNNSYNQPAFFVGDGAVRFPIGSGDYTLQVSGYNIFNIYNSALVTQAGGVGVPLYNGQTGLTNGNTVGPRTFNFVLSKTFGG